MGRPKVYETDAKKLHEGRRQMYEAVEEYRRLFLDPSTGLIADNLTEERTCPVCESSSDSTLFIKNGGTYVKCRECGMVYINPVLKDEELKRYYENNTLEQSTAHEKEAEFYTSIYQRGLYNIKKHIINGALLDVGCSGGFFLDIAKKYGFQTYGIELNRSEYKISRNKGHEVFNLPIQDIDFEDKFDIITMWDVFEHIKNGKNYLEHLKNYLREDGIIFLQIPNAASLASRILHERCNMFDGIEHVNLYTPKSIAKLCEYTGYKIMNIETVISELQIVKRYLEYEDPYFGDDKDLNNFMFLTEKLIMQNNMGYKMQIIIKPG